MGLFSVFKKNPEGQKNILTSGKYGKLCCDAAVSDVKNSVL